MDRAFLVIGAWFGFFAVAFGAFGSHALRERLAPGASCSGGRRWRSRPRRPPSGSPDLDVA
ncbi:MAG: hypothetical protein ACE14W_11165 [Candidatus Velamenicoccus archaeovorus]